MAIVGAYQSYSVLKAEETRNADNTFLQHAGDRATVLMWEVQRVVGDLQIVTAYMAVSFDWREDYFREKFKNLTAGILERSPGTQGLTWVPMVSDPAERAMLEEQQARQLNLPSTPAQSRITSSGQSVRCIYYKDAAGANLCSPPTPVGGPWSVGGPGVPHAFFPVLFLEPVEDPSGLRSSNAAAIMYDLSSNAARNASISKAILQGSASATSRLLLVQETATQYGLIVFVPVFQSLPCSPAPSAPVCRTLAGLTDAVFRISDLVIKSQQGLAQASADIRGEQYLLDLGAALGADGHVGARVFHSDSDCASLGNYSAAWGVDELYASTNVSATAPGVRARLAMVLPAICRSAQERGDVGPLLVGHQPYSFSGVDSDGAFLVSSFMVADRRWLFIGHSTALSYRASLATAAPGAILAVGVLLAAVFFVGLATFIYKRRAMAALNVDLVREQLLTSRLLHNIFPHELVPRVVAGEKLIAQQYESASIIFSDIVGFTTFSSHVEPSDVVMTLNIMYDIFDDICTRTGVYKVETIGDGYMIAAGCPNVSPDSVVRAAETALLMRDAIPRVRSEIALQVAGISKSEYATQWAGSLNVRIGINTGPVFAGVAGKRNPRFHLFGDTVNTASRMESNGLPGQIQLSAATREALEAAAPGRYVMTERGDVDIKGKGLMTLHWLTAASARASSPSPPPPPPPSAASPARPRPRPPAGGPPARPTPPPAGDPARARLPPSRTAAATGRRRATGTLRRSSPSPSGDESGHEGRPTRMADSDVRLGWPTRMADLDTVPS
eukprot:CAMPEP_0172152354 /NCGR_PEP_ID=MMETSP1050-20130122/793_1 /TAXON_ID=233186 /ORGANISM="Cryptomonas curvata, Strain CCAP979/52" /LENGTH=785 /DNA_ID=CAMNT_0012820671 /DNA_START=143 /DNA_END=2501 /DNA_ORIENTATION=+